MPQEIELSKEQSEQLARVIKEINTLTLMVDVDYAKAVVKASLQDCNFQDSAAVLSRSYNPDKVNLVREQMQGLQHLIDYIETMYSVTKKKAEIEQSEDSRKQIDNLFF